MTAVTRFAKAHVALIGAVATWLVAALKDGHITGQEWYGLLVAVATGLGVALVPNRKPTVHRRIMMDAGAVALWPLVVVAVLLGLILGAAGHPWWFLLLLALILLVV